MKQPNWKVPFILSGTLLALGSFAYWLQYSHKPKSDKAAALTKKPIPIGDEQITHFKIKSSNGLIEGKCESLAQKTCKPGVIGSWTITYPTNVKGDSEAIKEILSNMANIQATETIDLAEETPEKQKRLLGEYGLSDEKRTSLSTQFAEVTLENGKKLAAWFGEEHPLGDKTFVGSSENANLNSKTIFLIANFYKNNLFGKTLTYFRDKTLFAFNRGDVISFEGRTTKGKLVGKLENGAWTINGVPGDYEHIETFLSAVAGAKAKEFVEKSALNNAKSIVQFKITAKSGDNRFEVFEKKNKGEGFTYFMKTSYQPEVVEIENLLKNQVDLRNTDLRQTQILLKPYKALATRFKLEGKGFKPAAEFSFDGKDWKYSGQGEKLNADQAFAVLDQLGTLRAKDIISPAPAKSSELTTISIGDEKNPTRTHFEIYKVKDKIYGIDLNSKANEAYVLDDKFKKSFPFTRELWKMK